MKAAATTRSDPSSAAAADTSGESSNNNYQAMGEEPDVLHRVTAPPEESHTRSILKGITWRFVATMTTVVIAWLVIGEASIAFEIGFFEVFAKIAIYYLHERLWSKIPL
jgi:uncharacterized membrane protein